LERHSVLEVNLEALKLNLDLVKTYLFEHQKIIAIVKANAYGLGATAVASMLKKHGVDFFAVACIGEALDLRHAGITDPILVLSPFFEEESELFIRFDIIPTIVDFKRASLLNDLAAKQNIVVPVHIKVDTGMGRIGISLESAVKQITAISSLSSLKITGIFSHFPSADLLDDFTQLQISSFKTLCLALEKEGISIAMKHIANSSGLISFNDPFFNAVRPGIVLYGTYPSKQMKDIIFPQNVVTWKSRVIQVKQVQKDETISYGRTFKAPGEMKVSVIPVGYADGFSTLNSGKGLVYIQESPCPILGRICMDYMMVDTNHLEVSVGDEVILCGDYDGIRPDEIAQRTGLIAYEILTGINASTNRRYF